jgi:hypothetical protein
VCAALCPCGWQPQKPGLGSRRAWAVMCFSSRPPSCFMALCLIIPLACTSFRTLASSKLPAFLSSTPLSSLLLHHITTDAFVPMIHKKGRLVSGASEIVGFLMWVDRYTALRSLPAAACQQIRRTPAPLAAPCLATQGSLLPPVAVPQELLA